ncbi:EEF1A lysine methyltransferase 2 [Parasteatoda tepidariorum]|uniref:EEF1A lysine methyltransferase 2 n=1 Tax=Parasteatoda tepidariorum TaxID=114398 RepID=UPI00077FC34E|nr:EEF1A lysine methyltransferase 2 [Parasteatoda tepidariorum]
MSCSDDENLSLSELGKKEYWDQFYTTELENFDDFGEEGDIWFGRKNLERIVGWLIDNEIDKSASILDAGCGNGMTLISLAKVGFENLTGIDYSIEAIELAKKVAERNKAEIKYWALDILQPDPVFVKRLKEFHIIIDKGTYDAICLDREHIQEKREQYIQAIQNLLSPMGYFIIFSCNWTKEELLLYFKDWTLHDEIKIPTINFGGKTGQTVTALVLHKNKL